MLSSNGPLSRHLSSWTDTAHSLPRNQVPEWASAYINYKGLKKLIKAASQTSQNGEKVDLAGKQTSQGPLSLLSFGGLSPVT